VLLLSVASPSCDPDPLRKRNPPFNSFFPSRVENFRLVSGVCFERAFLFVEPFDHEILFFSIPSSHYHEGNEFPAVVLPSFFGYFSLSFPPPLEITLDNTGLYLTEERRSSPPPPLHGDIPPGHPKSPETPRLRNLPSNRCPKPVTPQDRTGFFSFFFFNTFPSPKIIAVRRRTRIRPFLPSRNP